MANMRVTGLSGVDTESMIQKIIEAEEIRVNEAKKKLTSLSWKQESYRMYAQMLQSFQSSFLSLSTNNSFKYSTVFNLYKTSMTQNGQAFSGFKLSTSGAQKDVSFQLNVEQLATSTKWEGAASASAKKLTTDANFSGPISYGAGEYMEVVVDGVMKQIDVSGTFANAAAFASHLNSELASAYGMETLTEGKVEVVDNLDGTLSFVTNGSHTFTYVGGSTAIETDMGTSLMGKSNKIDLSGSVQDELGITGLSSLTINGTTITGLSDTMSVTAFMNAINNSGAGITVSYDKTFDKISVETGIGAANDIAASQLGGLAGLLNLDTVTPVQTAQDAIVWIDGKRTTVSDNKIEHQGLEVEFDQVTGTGTANAVTIKSERDTSAIIEKITSFIEGYNEILSSLNAGYRTKRPKSDAGSYYDPLSEDEKAAMTESQIASWEEKAKTGLLYGDSTLESIVTRLQNAMVTPVTLADGTKISLSSIGISSTSWKDEGVLSIDEEKLAKALEENFDGVVALFTQGGSTNETMGLAERLDAAIDFAASTSHQVGKTGVLITTAGLENTTYSDNNYMSSLIKDQQEKIDRLLEKLYAKENKLYLTFGRMETAIMQMESQMNYLTQAFSY